MRVRTLPTNGCGPVSNPVRYLLSAVMQRALLDLAAFGRPLPTISGCGLEDGVTHIPRGCDCDARDALAWLSAYGADWCELLDLPREWAREAMNERMLAQQEALSA